MVKNDRKEQVAQRVSKKLTFSFFFFNRKTLIAALVSILSKTDFCYMFLFLLFIYFLLYCSTRVLISASPWLQVLHFEIQSSRLKKKNQNKTKRKPKKPNTTSLEGNREVIQCSCSDLVLLLYSPIPKSSAEFHSLVDEPLAGLLPPAGSTPHISVLHPIDLSTLFPLPSRLPQAKCYSRR